MLQQALLAGLLAWGLPTAARAEHETPPPSRLRNPLSGVVHFLEQPAHGGARRFARRAAPNSGHDGRVRLAMVRPRRAPREDGGYDPNYGDQPAYWPGYGDPRYGYVYYYYPYPYGGYGYPGYAGW